MHFAREPLDGVVFASDGAGELVSSEFLLHSPCEMREAVLGDDQLARQIDQRVDLRLVHAK